MKKYIVIIAATLLALTAVAQEKADVRERVYAAKLKHLTRSLDLTDEQRAPFAEIYQRYNQEMHKVLPAGRDKRPAASDAASEAKAIKDQLQKQKAAIDVQAKYIDQFARVLTAKQLHRFLQSERKISSKFKAKRDSARMKQHGRDFSQKSQEMKARKRAMREKARARRGD